MISAVVLAAGRSRRMGMQKLLLPFGGKPLIARIVDELMQSPLEEICVVVGSDSDHIQEALRQRPVEFVRNPDSDGEMLGSVRCGLRALRSDYSAALFVLGDQPNLTSRLVGELIAAFEKSGAGIIVPVHNGHRGHPLLVARRFRDELLTQHDGAGLRGLLDAHASEIHLVEVGTASVLEDMDTPQDYERLARSA